MGKVADALKTGGKVAGLLAPLSGKYSDEHGEWEEVRYAGIPLWKRDAKGRPRLLGIPFGRWIRGPRK